jgi:hypothetical protein
MKGAFLEPATVIGGMLASTIYRDLYYPGRILSG